MKHKLSGLFLIFGLLILTLIAARQVNAASKDPSGLTIAPAFQQVTLKSSDNQQTVQFTITNDKSSPQTLDLSVSDFNTLGESGGLFFVGTNPTELQKKYGLAKWASLPSNQVTIEAKQTVTITLDVLNQPDLSPGGHYGALMITAADSRDNSDTKNNVGLHPIASALMFVTKQGGETYKLVLANVTIQHSLFSLPSSANLRFHNTGNTHVIPRGVVSVFNSHNKLLKKGIINENSSIILPESFRQYSTPLKSITSPKWPGRYKVRVDFRFDGIDQLRSYQTTTFIIPPFSILIVVIIAGLFVIILKMIKRTSKTS